MPIGPRYPVRVLIAIMTAPTRVWSSRAVTTKLTCSVFGSWSCFDRRRVTNRADVADAMERTREKIDESCEPMASLNPLFAWITGALEPRRPWHCWSACACRPGSLPNLLIETLGC
jgi:hypothetical protein